MLGTQDSFGRTVMGVLGQENALRHPVTASHQLDISSIIGVTWLKISVAFVFPFLHSGLLTVSLALSITAHGEEKEEEKKEGQRAGCYSFFLYHLSVHGVTGVCLTSEGVRLSIRT
ncbi:hypothetical protein E2C01_038797 [Portunus trituberculatus]|uniref:Uncharacterized protein n=1 Tax=Portunus trituberculatus TaxID=210409 RepID=A0A5B7FF34_PORTR|nr:hypothetical protein [Portunus trituberculatus]